MVDRILIERAVSGKGWDDTIVRSLQTRVVGIAERVGVLGTPATAIVSAIACLGCHDKAAA